MHLVSRSSCLFFFRGVKEGIVALVGSKVKGPFIKLRLKKRLKRGNQACPKSGRNPLQGIIWMKGVVGI